MGRVPANHSWVLGLVSLDDTAQVRFQYVDNRRAETLLPIIQAFVPHGATVVTDCWRAYNGLTRLGYNHLTVNHTNHFVDPATGKWYPCHMANNSVNVGIWKIQVTDNIISCLPTWYKQNRFIPVRLIFAKHLCPGVWYHDWTYTYHVCSLVRLSGGCWEGRFFCFSFLHPPEAIQAVIRWRFELEVYNHASES